MVHILLLFYCSVCHYLNSTTDPWIFDSCTNHRMSFDYSSHTNRYLRHLLQSNNVIMLLMHLIFQVVLLYPQFIIYPNFLNNYHLSTKFLISIVLFHLHIHLVCSGSHQMDNWENHKINGLCHVDYLHLPSFSPTGFQLSPFNRWHGRLANLLGSFLKNISHSGEVKYFKFTHLSSCDSCRLAKQSLYLFLFGPIWLDTF